MKYNTRLQSLPERVDRAKKDLQQMKTVQLIGADVITPHVLQRYLPDGVTPTSRDIEGVHTSLGGGLFVYEFDGTLSFTAESQAEPWAYPYFNLWSNSNSNPDSANASATAYLELSSIQTPGLITYNIGGAVLDFGSGAADRLWAKVYLYATDKGTMEIELTKGTLVTV